VYVQGSRFVRWAAAACCALVLAACGGSYGDSGGDGAASARPTLPEAVTTSGAGARATLDGQPFVAVRTLPAAALSAEKLESAGSATGDGGERVEMARVSNGEAQNWELVSPADDGWRVWQPQIVIDVVKDAGAGATVVDVEEVDWPDSCLGAPDPDEVCSQIVTPGYRIIVERDGKRIEYHAARVSGFRRVGSP
jgi:hypothetical protein